MNPLSAIWPPIWEKKHTRQCPLPGPVNTLSARGIKGFTGFLGHVQSKTPLQRNIEGEEVGKAALFLCSDLSSGITGETIYIDAGYHILGA